MTEPEAPVAEKLASPEGIERTPRTSISFFIESEVCDLADAAAMNKTAAVTAR